MAEDTLQNQPIKIIDGAGGPLLVPEVETNYSDQDDAVGQEWVVLDQEDP